MAKTLFVPLLAYIIGFVYVQGMYSPFFHGPMLLEKVRLVIPVSQQTYLINGVVCLTHLFIAALIGYTFWVSSIGIKRFHFFGKRKLSNLKVYNILSRKIFTFDFVFTYKYIIIFGILAFGNIIIVIYEFLWAYSEYFFLGYFTVFFFVCFVGLNEINAIFEKTGESEPLISKAANTLDHRERTLSAHTAHSWFIATVFFALAFSIYLYGFIFQAAKVEDFQKQRDTYRIAQITTKSGTGSYLPLDYSKDQFIGFSQSDGTVHIIPTSEISDIQIRNVINRGEIPKWTGESRNPVSTEQAQMIQSVSDYYSSRLKYQKTDFDASLYISLLSQSTYRKMNYVSASLLQKRFENGHKYYGQDIDDFLGYEMSYPIYDDRSGTYSVFVIEYWKQNMTYQKIAFVQENNIWKMQDSKPEEEQFQFKMMD